MRVGENQLPARTTGNRKAAMRFIFVLSIIFAGLCINPAPAEAASVPVFVDIRANGQTSNVKAGAKFVDKYTKTRFVYGSCRYEYRCIRVRIDGSRQNGTAWTTWKGSARKTVTITVNPARGDSYMKRLFAHEVGHAMFLSHSRHDTNLMWAPIIKRNGKLVPMRFTTAQKTTLRRH